MSEQSSLSSGLGPEIKMFARLNHLQPVAIWSLNCSRKRNENADGAGFKPAERLQTLARLEVGCINSLCHPSKSSFREAGDVTASSAFIFSEFMYPLRPDCRGEERGGPNTHRHSCENARPCLDMIAAYSPQWPCPLCAGRSKDALSSLADRNPLRRDRSHPRRRGSLNLWVVAQQIRWTLTHRGLQARRPQRRVCRRFHADLSLSTVTLKLFPSENNKAEKQDLSSLRVNFLVFSRLDRRAPIGCEPLVRYQMPCMSPLLTTTTVDSYKNKINTCHPGCHPGENTLKRLWVQRTAAQHNAEYSGWLKNLRACTPKPGALPS
jgi:hypothetical protein